MDAIELLKRDHAAVKELFKQAEELGERAFAGRQKLFQKIDKELTVHAQIEEKVFYPAYKAKTAELTEERDEVLEAYTEHVLVKTMLRDLEKLDPSDESYKPNLHVLSELIEHHVKDEESKLFKEARKLLTPEELETLGERMEELKEKATARA